MASEQIITSPEPDPIPRAGIRDPATINALADPTRYAILNAVVSGARTVREVAERIGRRPGSLYRHFDVLESMGLITRTGSVETARRDARLYEADPRTGFVYEPGNPELAEAISNVVASAARNAARAFARAAHDGAVTRGPHRDTHMTSHSGWLSDDELETYNRKLDEIREFLTSRERRPGTRLIHSTLIVAPPTGRGSGQDDHD